MLGIVRANTKASVPAVAPNVEAMTTSRMSPRPRLRMLPRAMTAAALATRRWVRPCSLLPCSGSGVTGAVCMWLQAPGRDPGTAAGPLCRAPQYLRVDPDAERPGALQGTAADSGRA